MRLTFKQLKKMISDSCDLGSLNENIPRGYAENHEKEEFKFEDLTELQQENFKFENPEEYKFNLDNEYGLVAINSYGTMSCWNSLQESWDKVYGSKMEIEFPEEDKSLTESFNFDKHIETICEEEKRKVRVELPDSDGVKYMKKFRDKVGYSIVVGKK